MIEIIKREAKTKNTLQLAITEKALELAVEYLSCDVCPHGDGMNYCYKVEEYDEPPADIECKNYIASYFK